MSTICRRTLFTAVRRYSRISHQLKLRTGSPKLSHLRVKSFCPSGVLRTLSTQAEANVADDQNVDAKGERRDFQAETRMLLDIVAKSLYSNNEVFLRELISNASDALEKLRYMALQDNAAEDLDPLKIEITTNKPKRYLIIEDNGVGMTKEELVSNLGTIARSGSKAFLEEVKNNKSTEVSSIIGQFGVGFYSCFIVANKVEVFTRTRRSDAEGYCWTYDGTGQYEIKKVDDLNRGTKIVLHLKSECREFADNDRVRELVKKYSNFVNYPILINNEKCNTVQPLWLMDPKEITQEEYTDFYRFVSNSFDKPRFRLHYRTDAPMAIKALLYVPTVKPTLTEMNRDLNVALYAKRVLIKNKANELLPEWCGFLTGVVDCEDIPLNLSRELLQNSQLIAKLRNVLTNRVIRFLSHCAQKNLKDYDDFYRDYHMYLKAGVMTSDPQSVKEEIAKLLRFETSNTTPGEAKSLTQYLRDLPNEEEKIYYLFAPSRGLALTSPYYETLKKNGREVIFVHELHDEHVLMSLRTFRNKQVVSAEDEVKNIDDDDFDFGRDALPQNEINDLLRWVKEQLNDSVAHVKVTNKLDAHPCAITVENMGAARHILKMQSIQKKISDEMRDSLLAANLQLNPRHVVIKKLSALSKSNPELASLLVKQLFYNAMLAADLLQDASQLLVNMNDLLKTMLEQHED